MQIEVVAAWVRSRIPTGIVRSERGASLVEYALLVALIAVVCIGAVTFLGRETSDAFSDIGNSLN